MKIKLYKLAGLFLLQAMMVMVILGCTKANHNFLIRFNDIKGLIRGGSVYFDETAIGDVKGIEYTDSGSFLVSVSLKKQFAPTVTDRCKFYIDEDPTKGEHKIIRVVKLEEGGNQIIKDTIVDGHSKYSIMYDQFSHQLSRKIDSLETEINHFIDDLKGFNENEQIREIERQLDKIINEIGSMSHDMRNNLKLEILPLLQEKIEELRKHLKKNGQEEKLNYVDQKISIINDRLQI